MFQFPCGETAAMDDLSMNHYEQQLYSVFKSFDVNNEESLNETAVNNLCDALQLEERGAALVDTLFERRDGRVTFAQFRSGLLAVLGEPRAEPPAPPDPPPSPPLGEEPVAPRLVFGSKQYGRRSRPQHSAAEERVEPRAASTSRLEGDTRRAPQRPRFRRSASAAERREDEPALEHDRRIDRDEALALCRSLRMQAIDRRLVERIFDESPTPETTVGEFFSRLNSSLGSEMEEGGEAGTCSSTEDEGEPGVEVVVEAWERAGVPCPRRLLVDLCGGGKAVRVAILERALDAELRALEAPLDARGTLLAAALALARLRAASADTRQHMHAAEREKLRGDVTEANERARLLAQEVDESHARIEKELKASLKRAEAKHAEEARRARSEAAQERERAEAERARAEAEAARRVDAEARLRADVEEARRRADEATARALSAEERAATSERASARSAARLREAEARCAAVAEAERAAQRETARAAELQRDNQRLRDRADELCAALESSSRRAPSSPPAPRGDLSAELRSVLLPDPDPDRVQGDALDSISLEKRVIHGECVGQAECMDVPKSPSLHEPTLEGQGEETSAGGDHALHNQHSLDEEKRKLTDLVKELESALEAMRGEYEACEEYWSGKLGEERAAHEHEARLADERLGDLLARIAAFERRLAPPAPSLPPIVEAGALEAQVADLEAEYQRYRRSARARLAALTERLERAERRLAAPCERCERVSPSALAARCARAEVAVRRLQARLAAADTLVKDLYVENCQLAHARPLPL